MILRRAFLLALVLSSCATFDAPIQYADLAPDVLTQRAPQSGHAEFTWRFVSKEALGYLCQNKEAWGCSMSEGDRCVLFVLEPKDFHDEFRLAVIGHEAWHCMGAKHG